MNNTERFAITTQSIGTLIRGEIIQIEDRPAGGVLYWDCEGEEGVIDYTYITPILPEELDQFILPEKRSGKYRNAKANPYNAQIGGVKADPYRIMLAYGITHPAHQHALKKLLRAGRTHKSLDQDIQETIESLQRWQEMRKEENL